MSPEISRRRFVVMSGAVALAARHPFAFGAETGFPSATYERATVIDALGAIGEFDPKDPDNTLISASALADAKHSGVTAVNYTIASVQEGPGKFEEAVRAIAEFDEELQRHSDVLIKILLARDIRAAKSSGRVGVIYGMQNTTMLEGDVDRLKVFHGLGLRIVQPTYNLRNPMGDGCLEPANGGLTALGHALVAEINRLHIVLDLSHAGPRTAMDGIRSSKAPMAISHSGCRALVDVPRNVDDEILRALANRGGVLGIAFIPFLRTSGQPHAEDVIRHLEHAVNVGGEDHVGLGTDGLISGTKLDAAFTAYQREYVEARRKAGIAAPGESPDIFNLVPEYNEPRRFLKLADDLSRRGWKSSRIEKILGANFDRLFREVWGD